jgi:signal transduction histidine kinase
MAIRDFLRRESPASAANRHVPTNPPRAPASRPVSAREQLEAAREEIAGLLQRQGQYEMQLRLLREAVEARDVFLANAGNELRNPMAGIALAVTNLIYQGDRSEEIPRWVLDRLASLDRQTRNFVRRSTTLLEVTRIAAGKVHIQRESLDLGALVREQVRDLTAEAQGARCELRVQLADDVRGAWERAAVEQIASSLLSNAIKYGAGQAVDVYVRRERGLGILAVRDRGPGIGAIERARVYEPFERAVGQREGSGFGLGLWIARQLLRAHGGELAIEAEAGVGSVFVATLPLPEGTTARP